TIDVTVSDSINHAMAANAFGPFSEQAVGTQEFVTVENEKYILTFSTKGAYLVSAKLKEYHTYKKRFIEEVEDTLDLMVQDASQYGFLFSAKGKNINTEDLYFVPSEKSINVSGKDIKTLSF